MMNFRELEKTKLFVWKKLPAGVRMKPTKRLKQLIGDLTRLAYDDKIEKIQEFVDDNPQACEFSE